MISDNQSKLDESLQYFNLHNTVIRNFIISITTVSKGRFQFIEILRFMIVSFTHY